MTKRCKRFYSASRPFRGGQAWARTPEETSVPDGSELGGANLANIPALPISSPPGPFVRSSGATRRRVIEAGARVFADLGFHKATKEGIGTAAGFSHQTVRDYFATKGELLTAIVTDAWRNVIDAMHGAANGSELEQLLAGFNFLEVLSRTRPAEVRCMLHEAQIAGPNGGPLLIEEQQRFKQTVEQLVATATGLSGASVIARTDVILAAMEALTRLQVVTPTAETKARYSSSEATESFRTLAASMLQPAS